MTKAFAHLLSHRRYPPGGRRPRFAAVLGERRGIALIATLLVVVLVAAIVAAAVTAAMSVTRSSTADYLGTRAFYAAEAGAEHALSLVELALQDGFLSDDELAAITPPELEGFNFSQFRVQKEGIPDTVTITDGPFAGLYALNQDILVTSRATDASGAHSAVIIGAKAQAIPLFQFAGFGEGALESYSGSRTDTWGRLHVNGDIYMATVDAHYHDMLTTPGRFIRDGRTLHVDKSDIHVYIEDAAGVDQEVDFDSEDTPDPEMFKWKSESRLDGRLRTGAMGVDSLKLPLPDGVSPRELIRPKEADDTDGERAAKFAWQADMYVTVDLSKVQNREDVCGASPPPGLASKLPMITVTRPKGGVAPTGADKCRIFSFKWEAFWDFAELKWTDVADVDIGELRNWVNADPDNRGTQIVYVEIVPSASIAYASTTDKSNDGFYFPVLRLKNAARLPGPLTIGSEYPLFVQGDYNNINKQPAATFSDRLTVLSNRWRDHDSSPVVPGDKFPDADDTEQYFAVITGEGEGYLGCYHHGPDPGCEPIPADKEPCGTIKMLEDWSYRSSHCSGRCNHTLIGSFVTFWAPHIASKWGNYPGPFPYYRPPTRNWSFDYDFMDPANLPPGTPNVGYVLRASFREAY